MWRWRVIRALTGDILHFVQDDNTGRHLPAVILSKAKNLSRRPKPKTWQFNIDIPFDSI
jgi:hypothetical protein